MIIDDTYLKFVIVHAFLISVSKDLRLGKIKIVMAKGNHV